MTRSSFIRCLFCSILLVYSSSQWAAVDNATGPSTITYDDGEIELTASCYLSPGESILVFLPSVYSPFEDQEKYASEIAAGNLSACISHVFTDLFLPVKGNSYDQIPVAAMLHLLNSIKRETGKFVYLVGHGSGNRVNYQIASHSLQNGQPGILSGLIMFSPNLTAKAPNPGEEQQYITLIHEKTLPLYIFQPSYSPHHWHLDKLIDYIQKSGTTVIFQRLPDVRDGYAFRQDRSEKEQDLRINAAKLFKDAITQLRHD